MADQAYVDHGTGTPLTTIAMGVVAAGTASTEREIEWRYKWGESAGPGHVQTAFILRVSTDGGVTWTTDSTQFVLRIVEALNPGNDPEFLGAATAAVPTARLDVAPARANTGYVVGIKCQPDLRPGTAQESLLWELGVLYNETFRSIGIVPDMPSGVLPGLGDSTVSEWVLAPTLTNDTDKVTLGAWACVVGGRKLSSGGGDVTLNQDDGSSATLASGQEYLAVLSVGSAGTVTTTKGDKATAGAAVQPARPAGELPLAVVRVPYGGVIVASTLLAVSGRCLVTDAGGLVVTCGPGRAHVPGFLLTPVLTTLTLPDDATTTVYLSSSGTFNLTGGLEVASVVTAGGDITSVTDLRRLLLPPPLRLSIPGTETIATASARLRVPYDWTLEKMEFAARIAAAGATGSTGFVLQFDGSTIGDDSLAAGSSSATWAMGVSDSAGWLTLDIDGVTSGGTPAEDLEMLLWIVEV